MHLLSLAILPNFIILYRLLSLGGGNKHVFLEICLHIVLV